MRLDHLWLTDFRNYAAAELSLPPGLLAVTGENGAGKSNLLEAIGYLATQSSFRGAANDALVRAGADRAVVRGLGYRGDRELLVEAEIRPAGRSRMTVNRQPLRRAADLAGGLRVTVFSPDDLDLVKGGPTGRRRYLDDVLAALHPRHEAARRDLDRVLRQRNALLAQVAGAQRAGGRPLDDATATTLDVWDARLVEAGTVVGMARAGLVRRLEPEVARAYADVGGPEHGPVAVGYEAAWLDGGLAAALAAARREELRRGVTLVGPHRDELGLSIAGLPARTHASQGEQRSLALALRLASHHLVAAEVGSPPLLLLDDVFSELDRARAQALVRHLPAGQAVLTTAGELPVEVAPEAVIRIEAGCVA